MVVGHLGTFGEPLSARHFFSKFDSVYFSLLIFLKYLFVLLLIMISFIIMTLLEKQKLSDIYGCRTLRDPTNVKVKSNMRTHLKSPRGIFSLTHRELQWLEH